MATAGSNTDPLGSGEPSGATYANNLTLLGEFQQQNQDLLAPTGASNLNAASGNLANVAQYEQGILSGDRQQILATEAPEISQILKSYDTTRKAQAELEPRGGGRSATLNELPYQEAGDVNKLIEQARPQAAQTLSQVAGEQAQIGESAESLFASNVNSSLSFLIGKAGVQLDSATLQSEQGAQLGQAIGLALPELLTLATGT